MANPFIQLGQWWNNLFLTPAGTNDSIYFSTNNPIPYGAPAAYPNPNALRFVQDGYSGNASVYTIISMISRRFGALPRYVYQIQNEAAEQKASYLLKNLGTQTNFTQIQRAANLQRKAYNLDDDRIQIRLEKKSAGEDEVDNALSELLLQPNPWQGQDSFFEMLCTFYLTTGEAFIWLNRDAGPDEMAQMDDDEIMKIPVLEMYWMPTQWVKIVPDKNNVWGVSQYIFQIGGIEKYIRAPNCIHWKRPNPNFDAYARRHLRGFSPLDAGNKVLTQDESATDASVALEQNLGARGFVFDKNVRKYSPEQESALTDVLNNKINNPGLRGAISALQGDWGNIDLSMTAVELDLENAKSSVFRRMCNLFGISPMMFETNTTYANVEQARKDMITGLIYPMACSLKDEMNRVLRPAFNLGNDFTIDTDISELPELQDDMSKKIAGLAQAWWLTPNERREQMNLEELQGNEEMDKVWIPMGMQLMADAAMPLEMPTGFTPGPNDVPAGTDNQPPNFSLNGNNGNGATKNQPVGG